VKVEIRSNGRQEIRLTEPTNSVQAAALEMFGDAVERTQVVKVERIEGGVMIVLEMKGMGGVGA
jgi:hypothetical protein